MRNDFHNFSSNNCSDVSDDDFDFENEDIENGTKKGSLSSSFSMITTISKNVKRNSFLSKRVKKENIVFDEENESIELIINKIKSHENCIFLNPISNFNSYLIHIKNTI
jgi:hypothetical protein